MTTDLLESSYFKNLISTPTKKLIYILAAVLIALLFERIFFTTTKYRIESSPPNLYASSHSEMIIEVIPINLIGIRTPLSKASSAFVIEEGTNLIEIIKQDISYAVIKSKGKEGEAVIGIYSVSSGVFIGRVLITILPGEIA